MSTRTSSAAGCGSATSARLRALTPSKALQRTARILPSATCFRRGIEGERADHILTAKHVVVPKIPGDGGKWTAQPLKPQHLVSRAEHRPDAAILVVNDPAEIVDVAELEEERQQPSSAVDEIDLAGPAG